MTKLPKIEVYCVDPQKLHAYQRWCATEDGVIYAYGTALEHYTGRDSLIGVTIGQLRALGYTAELDYTC